MSSSSARIFEKTTATTRAPLSRIRDGDISPQKQLTTSDQIFAVRERGLIGSAMQIAKNRMQFGGIRGSSASTSKQSIDEYINQKKEMFRVILA